jgi:hypothetical protein
MVYNMCGKNAETYRISCRNVSLIGIVYSELELWASVSVKKFLLLK